MCSDAQAWKIYYLIYGDVKNKMTQLYEPTKSQEVLRENLEKLGWKDMSSKTELFNKIKLITSFDASDIIRLLTNHKFFLAENIIKEYAKL